MKRLIGWFKRCIAWVTQNKQNAFFNGASPAEIAHHLLTEDQVTIVLYGLDARQLAFVDQFLAETRDERKLLGLSPIEIREE